MGSQKRMSVADVMRTNVMTLTPDDTIERALEVFEAARIGGAPVVDALGQLLGVLTLSDVAMIERRSERRAGARRHGCECGEPMCKEFGVELEPDEFCFLKKDPSVELLGRVLVSDWMSGAVVAIPPSTPIDDACRTMVERNIHRVFVEEHGKLVGVVSSFDVVRHVARAPLASARAPRAE